MNASPIADFLERDKTQIIQMWIAAVRADPRIQSDADLSEGGLVDHVPHMLEEIISLLRLNIAPSLTNVREARVHAYTRFRQGYRARDLVRETSLLRFTLLDYLNTQWDEERLQISFKDFSNACRSINSYIDEELRYAVAIYTETADYAEATAEADKIAH